MGSWIVQRMADQGMRIAVIFRKKEYSYLSLYERIIAYSHEVKLHISPGETVAVISDYSFESIALFFALYENHNVIVPITTQVESEIEDRINVARCSKIIKIESDELCYVDRTVEEPVYTLVKDLQKSSRSGLILFSSGSTGAPKAMIHDLGNLVDSYKGKKGKQLVFLIFLMFDHIGGLNTLLNCLAMGVTMVFPSNRNPDHVMSLVERYKVNILPASPTFLNLILINGSQEHYDCTSLRMITYGTEPMPDSLLLKLREVFPRVKFLQTFGTSETGISQTSSKSSDSTYIKIDDPNTEYKIVSSELWLRSKTQIMGYLNVETDRFTEDGWFKTGDLVEEAGDGYIKIVGRNKEMINVGGEKVLPSEVESVLFCMEDVKDCIVFGEANPIMGQMVVAKILFSMPIKISEAKKKIVSFCQDKLERYKIPSKVILMMESEYSERFKKKRIAYLKDDRKL